MAAFKTLKDVCNNFEEELRQVSTQLFSAKLEETFEDVVAKKNRDLLLFKAKSRLLLAKPLSLQPEITSQERNADSTLLNYGAEVTRRLIEKYIVKSATQAVAVKALLTAPDDTLDPVLLDRKGKILSTLTEYGGLELELAELETALKEKEDKLAEVRARWHDQAQKMRDLRAQASGDDVAYADGPYYRRLRMLCPKMEQMRWLIAKLATPRTRGYDWLHDPSGRLRALKLARKPCGVDSFVKN